MNEIMNTFNFENKPLTYIKYKGRPAFIAKEIGERLGYSLGGAQLEKLIIGKWQDFFQENKHYIILSGKDLYNLKKLINRDFIKGTIFRGASHIMLLLEPGVTMVAIRSQKYSAIRLQQFITEKVSRDLKRQTDQIENKEKKVQHIVKSFEGTPVVTITYRGRPCWLVKDVGAAIGYADKGLTKRIIGEWADEFENGEEVERLDGKELAQFKELYQVVAKLVPGNGTSLNHTPNLLLLYEPGLHLVLAKTNKPVGKRFRKFITREVMPQITSGQLVPNGGGGGAGPIAPVTDHTHLDILERHRMECERQRLSIDEKKAEAMLRNAGSREIDAIRRRDAEDRRRRDREAAAMRRSAKQKFKNGEIDALRLNARLHAADEHEVGFKLGTWSTPNCPSDSEQWISCSHLGKEVGRTANDIGRHVTALEVQRGEIIRGNPRYTKSNSGFKKNGNGVGTLWDGYLLGQEIADEIRRMVHEEDTRQRDLFHPDPHDSGLY